MVQRFSLKSGKWGRRHATGEFWPHTYPHMIKQEQFLSLFLMSNILEQRAAQQLFMYLCICEQQALIGDKEQTKFAASLAGNLIWVSRQASTNWMYIRTLFSLLSTLLSSNLQLFQPSEDMHILLHRGTIVCRRVLTTNQLNNSIYIRLNHK